MTRPSTLTVVVALCDASRAPTLLDPRTKPTIDSRVNNDVDLTQSLSLLTCLIHADP